MGYKHRQLANTLLQYPYLNKYINDVYTYYMLPENILYILSNKKNYKIEYEYSVAVDNNFSHNITKKATIDLKRPNKKLKGAALREWRLNQLQKLTNNQFAGLLRAIGYSTEEIDQFYGY